MRSNKPKIFTLIIVVLGVMHLSAQDYHYWSEQYGGDASLLGGAAIAGVGDNSTIYYNPGAMAFQPSLQKFSISANAYRVRYISSENGLGNGLHFENFNMMISPQLIAGMIHFKKAPKWRLSYALLTKNMFHFKLNTQESFVADILSGEQGDEYFIGNYEFENSLLDQWAGFGASFRVTDHFAIGMSYFGIYRTYKYYNNVELTAFPIDTAYHHISEFRSSINFDYWNISGIFKLGLAWDYDKIAIGLNFTSPTFGLFGSANEQRIFKIVNLDFLTSEDFAVIDREEAMPSHHRFPGSIGVGLNYVVSKKVVIYFSAEYFFPLEEYYVFSSTVKPKSYPELTEPEIEHIFGDAPFISFIEASKQVLNGGVGVRWLWKDNFAFLGGFRTDFYHNALGDFDMQRVVAESIDWDLYHLSLGIRKTGKKIVTAGIEFSFTPKTETDSFINLSDPDENTLVGDQVTATAQQFGLKFVISYTIRGN